MCYVIENFFLTFFKLAWNSKINSLFYYRTGNTSISLLKVYLNYPNFFKGNVNSAYLLNFTRFFFLGKLFSMATQAPFYPNQPLSLNFTKSVQYWALTRNLKGLVTLKENERYLYWPSLSFTPDYYQTVQISNIFLPGCTFKKSLFGFLQLVLTNWQSWNRQNKLLIPYLILIPKHLPLRFLNFYFFKIYNF